MQTIFCYTHVGRYVKRLIIRRRPRNDVLVDSVASLRATYGGSPSVLPHRAVVAHVRCRPCRHRPRSGACPSEAVQGINVVALYHRYCILRFSDLLRGG